MTLAGEPALPESSAPPRSAPGWQHVITVRGSGGYKDNVLLSAEDPEGSAFLGAGLEMFGWKPIGLGGQFQAFVVGEHRHFLSARDIEKEQTLVAEARLDQNLGIEWALSTPIQFSYVDQVLDVSATEPVPPTRVQGETLAARPALRWHTLPGTFEMQWNGLRQWYASPLDNTWETGVRLDWAPEFAGRTRANVYYDFSHAWYDQEPERDSNGDPRAGTRRRTQRHEGGLRVRHEWGEQDAWRLTTRIAGRYATDLASGYYDYVRPSMDLRLRHRRKSWLTEAGVRLADYRYPVQSAEPGSSRRRHRLDLVLELRGEFELRPWLRAFAEYSYEETFAHRAFESYTVNTVHAGFEATF
jgi:hypothetical protein